MEWTLMFSRIKNLRIWIAEGVLTDALRQHYLDSFLHTLQETTVHLG